MQVDAPTPDSEGLQRPQIPDTTQRRLEGFCLNTPLTLSQAAAAEVGSVLPMTAAAVVAISTAVMLLHTAVVRRYMSML